jgi:hypothetical protein
VGRRPQIHALRRYPAQSKLCSGLPARFRLPFQQGFSMTVNAIKDVLLWCVAINYFLLIIWVAIIALARPKELELLR